MEEKSRFYIFIDYDGVLNDLKTIPNLFHLGGFFAKDNDKVFNPNSIESLNFLIETLEKKYKVQLILTTYWRRNPEKAKNILYNNGLKYEREIDFVSRHVTQSRKGEIKKYLTSNNIKEDFLVIDDFSLITKDFKDKNKIKTNIIAGSLNMTKVDNYLSLYYPELVDKKATKII